MTLRQLIRFAINPPEGVPELDCSKGELRFAVVVVVICVVAVVM